MHRTQYIANNILWGEIDDFTYCSMQINEKLGTPERKYPRPRPPRDRKSHIYTPGGYSELEYNARRVSLLISIRNKN